ncbi:MAG: putative membrane protein, partial [Colwellia sp.]
MTYWQKFTLLNKRIRGVIYSAIAVLIYAIAGFFIVPLVLKPVVIDTLTEKLERQARLEAIEFNPFTLSITLKKFSITGKHTDKLLGFDLLILNLQALPLIQKIISFDQIIINQPEISVVILANGEYNFQ